MLLFDSSGVLKDEALDEHREALRCVSDAVRTSVIEPIQASGAVDWLLFDWLMAHRDGPQSAAVEIRSGKIEDATMPRQAAARWRPAVAQGVGAVGVPSQRRATQPGRDSLTRPRHHEGSLPMQPPEVVVGRARSLG